METDAKHVEQGLEQVQAALSSTKQRLSLPTDVGGSNFGDMSDLRAAKKGNDWEALL